MTKLFRPFSFLVLLLSLLSQPSLAKDRFKSISINELDAMLKQKKIVYVYDANLDSTRTGVGIVPGAKLISSSSQYDAKKELPPNKSSKLVFYCANQMCTASHTAAERAIDAGYKDVSVMKDGIFGWKKAGKPLAKVDIAPQAPATPLGTSAIEPKKAQELVKQGQAVIVDVREDEERLEIVEGSLWFPWAKNGDKQAWNEFKKQLPANKTVIFHCAAGYRSKKAAEKLSSEGVKSLYFQSPDEWKAAGLPLVQGPGQ